MTMWQLTGVIVIVAVVLMVAVVGWLIMHHTRQRKQLIEERLEAVRRLAAEKAAAEKAAAERTLAEQAQATRVAAERMAAKRAAAEKAAAEKARLEQAAVEQAIAEKRDIILVTGHRRESFGQGVRDICQALNAIARTLPEARIIYPVHLNPNVRLPVFELLKDTPNVYLEEPLPHKTFIRLMAASKMVLSDSGGIQEEAPSLGTPVLIMRNTTERPEGVESGVNMLVGTTPDSIIRHTVRLMTDSKAYAAMSAKPNPYGDGHASERIVDTLYCTRCCPHKAAACSWPCICCWPGSP